jgi:hypothetical protein
MKSLQFVPACLLLCAVAIIEAFPVYQVSSPSRALTSIGMTNDNAGKPKTFFDDLKGMMGRFDDVVDDFVYKRMGAGEQWYGKRKYNPSGKFDGDYNGMGGSDHIRIEIARVQKEEMEKRRQRRLAEEEETRRNK